MDYVTQEQREQALGMWRGRRKRAEKAIERFLAMRGHACVEWVSVSHWPYPCRMIVKHVQVEVRPGNCEGQIITIAQQARGGTRHARIKAFCSVDQAWEIARDLSKALQRQHPTAAIYVTDLTTGACEVVLASSIVRDNEHDQAVLDAIGALLCGRSQRELMGQSTELRVAR